MGITSRLGHVAFLSASLILILVLLLVTATVYKAPTASPRYPKQHLLIRPGPRLQHHRGVKTTVGQEAAGERQQRREVMNTMATSASDRVKTWPHLVGLDAEEAKKKILEEHPTLQVQVVPAGSMVTTDYNLRRVRIYKGADQKVMKTPQLG